MSFIPPTTSSISAAILKSVGVDIAHVYSVQFEHAVGSVPRLTIGMYANDPATDSLVAITRSYNLTPITGDADIA